MAKEKVQIGAEGIHDARSLGVPKMLILGFQHMFAMFGTTVLVPLLTGLDVATTLLMAGLGTLLFHVITGFKVPAFLGSSFAFLGGYGAIAPLAGDGTMTNEQLLPYACLGVACAGVVYLVLAALIKLLGAQRVMRFFPPVVTGPIIIAIGLGLAGSAVGNCQTNWLLAVIALVIVIVFNIWGKGMAKIIPILLGVAGSCAIAAVLAIVWGETITAADGMQYITLGGSEGMKLFSVSALEQLKSAPWIGFPIKWEHTVFGGVDFGNTSLVISSIVAIMPISLATMMEHIGDISAISSTVGKNFIGNPGLHRTLTGDGLATSIAALFGGPANTTYGENTGVLALSRVYDPRVIRIAAVIATVLSFSPKFAALVNLIPTAVIGGISFMLYGMISAIGVRNVVENQVDFTKSRNLIIAAIILVSALGLGSVSFGIGGLTITLSALACASIAGIVLNAILPGNDYQFGSNEDGDKAVNFQMKADHKDENENK
ncbi:MAG: uracil-xanthine permease [Clostridia bacterium]|nr:uracil-xanthine permease [Clostridia bacterium]